MNETMILRVVEHLHGHLGMLATAALWHPAIVLRRENRRAPLAAWLSTSMLTVTGIGGAYLYPPYRSILKQKLFVHAPQIGWMFERKEHLAVGALCLAWAGLIAHLLWNRQQPSAVRSGLARAAHLSFLGAAILSTLVGIIGVVVAVKTTF